jgi:hypothetical protein
MKSTPREPDTVTTAAAAVPGTGPMANGQDRPQRNLFDQPDESPSQRVKKDAPQAKAEPVANGHDVAKQGPEDVDEFDPERQRLKPQPGASIGSEGGPDPFDPENARLAQDFVAMAGAQKVPTSLAVMKPPRQVFFRVHPDPQYHIDIGLLELKEDRDGTYMVAQELQQELALDIRPVSLLLAVTRQQIPFFWPIRLPREGERGNKWWESARDAAQYAMTGWVRIEADMRAGVGSYQVYKAADCLFEPKWPQMSMRDLLRLAFKDRFVTKLDHPAVLALREVG